MRANCLVGCKEEPAPSASMEVAVLVADVPTEGKAYVLGENQNKRLASQTAVCDQRVPNACADAEAGVVGANHPCPVAAKAEKGRKGKAVHGARKGSVEGRPQGPPGKRPR